MDKTIHISSIEGTTLLSDEEYEKYEKMISPVEEAWWLRSPGISDRYAACVYSGSLSHNPVRYQLGVRPALRISNPESLNPSEKFKFGEQTFTYLGEGLALCDDIVGNCAFREDWEASDTNVYEKSDVKKYVDNWLEKIKEKETINMIYDIPSEAFFAEAGKEKGAFWVDKSDDASTNHIDLRLGYDPAYENELRKMLFPAGESKDSPLELFAAYYPDSNEIELYGYRLNEAGERESDFSSSYAASSKEYDYFKPIMEREAKALGYSSIIDMYESNENGYAKEKRQITIDDIRDALKKLDLRDAAAVHEAAGLLHTVTAEIIPDMYKKFLEESGECLPEEKEKIENHIKYLQSDECSVEKLEASWDSSFGIGNDIGKAFEWISERIIAAEKDLKELNYQADYQRSMIRDEAEYQQQMAETSAQKEGKTITISPELEKKIVAFCDDELDYHINDSGCAEEYRSEIEAQIELLRLLGHEKTADKYEQEFLEPDEEMDEELEETDR